MATITVSSTELSILYNAVWHHHDVLKNMDASKLKKEAQETLEKEIHITGYLGNLLVEKLAMEVKK